MTPHLYSAITHSEGHMNQPLVITATPTLFSEDQSLDVEANRQHLIWLRENGTDAIFAAGTTGEFTTLSDDERLAVLDVSLEVFGADRTYFHVGAASTYQAVALTSRSVAQGAKKLAAVTPFYQSAPEEEVVSYYRQIAEAADGAEVFAYLFEARTSTVSQPSILEKLVAVGVAGVKISGESDETVSSYLQARPEGFTVYSGNDISFGWLSSAGGDGIVSGVSSVYPEPFVNLRDALIAEDQEAVRRWQSEIERAVASVRAGSLTHLKAGVSARGFRGGPVRTAVAAAPQQDVDGIAALAAEFAAL